MKRRITLLLLSAVFSLGVSKSKAQDVRGTTQSEHPFSMTVTLNSDQFFGFYPFFQGSYGLTEKTAFTFYGILWSGGTGSAWGNWTEFGMGVSLKPSQSLTVTPQIGVLSGSLLSGLGGAEFGDGIVPNLTIGANTDKFLGELYGGYYYGLKHGNPTTLNYLHYWTNGGYKFNNFFAVGAHLEHLRFMGGNNKAEAGNAKDYYISAGPFVQFSNPNGTSYARFHVGPNLANESKREVASDSFWKLTLGHTF
ncbi:DUF6733 family protein [Adhaeribacter aquaticus]|uniref:DUF6733 family protein n=1 Tax=Adhaeribacter aquaticus TaxID=299567 RepID=UPI00041E4088|nr:DUF6733 family protein [Adhaeribacter aquaticus]